MDLSNILIFIGLFLSILLVLVGIAYFGIKEKSYEDALKEKAKHLGTSESINGNDVNKKKKVDKKKDKSKQQQQQKRKVDVETNEETESQEEEEEEPLVAVPDPFTNKVYSKLNINTKKDNVSSTTTPTTTTTSNVASSSIENRFNKMNKQHTTSTSSSTSSTVNQINSNDSTSNSIKLEKPKAAVKPNQTKNDVIQQPNNQDQNQDSNAFIKKDITKTKLTSAPMTLNQQAKPQIQIQQQQLPKVTVLPNHGVNEQHVNVDNQKQIKELENKLNGLNVTLADKDKENLKLKADCEKLQGQLGELQSMKQANNLIQNEMTKLTQRILAADKEKNNLEGKMKMEIERFKSQEQLLHQKLKEKETQFEAMKNDFGNINQKKEFEITINSLRAELQDTKNRLDDAIKQLNSDKLKYAVELESKDKSIQKLQFDFQKYDSNVNNNLKDLNDKLNLYQIKNKELSDQLIQLTQVQATTNGYNNNDELESLREQLKLKDNDLKLKANDLEKCLEEIETLKLKIKDMENNNKNLDNNLKDLNNNLNDTLNKLKEKEELLNKLQIDASNEDKNKSELNSQIKSLNELINELNNKNQNLSNEKSTLEARLTNNSNVQETESIELKKQLDNEINKQNELNANIKSLNELVDDLKAKLESKEEKLINEQNDKNNKEIENYKQQLNDLSTHLENEKNTIKDLNNQIAGLNETINKQKEDNQKSNDLKQDYDNKLKHIQELNVKLNLLNETINELNAKIESKDKLLNDKIKNDTENKQANDLAKNIENEKNSIKDLNTQLLNNIKMLKQENIEKNKNINELEDKIKLLNEKIDELNIQKKNEENDKIKVENNSIELDQYKTQLNNQNEENEKLKITNHQLKEILKLTEKNILELEDTVQNREKTLLTEINSYKTKYQKLEGENNKLKQLIDGSTTTKVNGNH